MSRRAVALVLLALALLTAAVYAPVTGFEFVAFDDDGYVYANPVVRQGLTAGGVRWAFSGFRQANYHPLTWVSHMLDVELFGMDPGRHHLTSLLLHMAAALLLFVALEALTGARACSATVAALFAVHPAHVESVAWASERKDVLCALFWALALLAYAGHARRPSPTRLGAVLLAFAGGLLSKPMIVTLPVTLLLLDYWPLGRLVRRDGTLDRGVLLEKVPFFALALLFGALTLAAQAGGAMPTLESFPLGTRLEKALLAQGDYLTKAFWPRALAVFYPQPLHRPALWVFLAWGSLLAALTAFAARARRRSPHLLVGWLWYLATLAPVSGVLQAGSQFVADRYTYVPFVGLFAAAAWGTQGMLRRAGVRESAGALPGAAATALVVAFALMARAQVLHWRDTPALFGHALAVTEGNWLAHLSLGTHLEGHGEGGDARRHFTEAIRLNPRSATAHFNLGALLERDGDVAGAAQRFRRAVELEPAFAPALLALAGQALRAGDEDEAERLLRAAATADPEHPEAHARLGLFLAGAGRMGEAVSSLSRAAALAPTDATAHFNLGAALAALGDLPGAAVSYRRALELRPGDPDAHNNLGVVLARLGRREEARAHFQEALRLAPGSPDAAANLERLRRGGGP